MQKWGWLVGFYWFSTQIFQIIMKISFWLLWLYWLRAWTAKTKQDNRSYVQRMHRQKQARNNSITCCIFDTYKILFHQLPSWQQKTSNIYTNEPTIIGHFEVAEFPTTQTDRHSNISKFAGARLWNNLRVRTRQLNIGLFLPSTRRLL